MRLTLVVDDEGIRILARRRSHRVLAPSEPIEASRRRAGFRVEVRDGDGRTRYVRSIVDPRPGEVEVPSSGRRDDAMVPVRDPRGRVTATVLVPDLGDGTEVVLLDLRGPQLQGGGVDTGEVARLPLHEGT